jgi:hypothetical protein
VRFEVCSHPRSWAADMGRAMADLRTSRSWTAHHQGERPYPSGCSLAAST